MTAEYRKFSKFCIISSCYLSDHDPIDGGLHFEDVGGVEKTEEWCRNRENGDDKQRV